MDATFGPDVTLNPPRAKINIRTGKNQRVSATNTAGASGGTTTSPFKLNKNYYDQPTSILLQEKISPRGTGPSIEP